MIVTALWALKTSVKSVQRAIRQPAGGGVSAFANPKRDAELLHGEMIYPSLSSCPHLPASLSVLTASLVLDSLETWQSKGLSAGMSAAEFCLREGRNHLGQPDPGGQWVGGAGFMLTPLFLQGEEGRMDAGAPFVLHLFPLTELLCLLSPNFLDVERLQYNLPPSRSAGFDLRAHASWDEKPCKVLGYWSVLKINAV